MAQFDSLARRTIRHALIRDTRLLNKSGADVIVWPELGTGLPVLQIQSQREFLGDELDGVKHLLLSGVVFADGAEYLRVAHTSVEGGSLRVLSVSTKANLVPFVERRLEADEARVIFDVKGNRIRTLICYDSVFPREFDYSLSNGSDLIVVTSEQGAFGTSGLSEYQTSIAVFYAASARTPLAFLGRGGVSAYYDPQVDLAVWKQGPNASRVIHVGRGRGATLAKP